MKHNLGFCFLHCAREQVAVPDIETMRLRVIRQSNQGCQTRIRIRLKTNPDWFGTQTLQELPKPGSFKTGVPRYQDATPTPEGRTRIHHIFRGEHPLLTESVTIIFAKDSRTRTKFA
jgi:hypothetical protein